MESGKKKKEPRRQESEDKVQSTRAECEGEEGERAGKTEMEKGGG